jgi:plasmid replication initiation protein
LKEEIAGTSARLDEEEAQSLTSLRARLSGLRDETSTIARALRDTEALALGEWRGAMERISTQLGEWTRPSPSAAATSCGRRRLWAKRRALPSPVSRLWTRV